MITGFIPPSNGTAVIGGCDIMQDSLEARKKIGYLPENAPVYPDMTVYAYLDFCAEIRGFSGSSRRAIVEETIEKCFLTQVRFQTISTLSKGYKQRVCFAQSILHDPEYLIFDEPTDGLDPNQKYEVRNMIREMSARKAIILSTHILDEVDTVCSRAIIIANGSIIADDTPSDLRAKSSVHGAVSLTLSTGNPEDFLPALRNLVGVRSADLADNKEGELKIRVYPETPGAPITDAVLSTLSEKKATISSVFVEQGRLDDVFRSLTTT